MGILPVPVIDLADALDVAVADLLVPDLQRLGADAVQDGKEARLERVLEHDGGIDQAKFPNKRPGMMKGHRGHRQSLVIVW